MKTALCFSFLFLISTSTSWAQNKSLILNETYVTQLTSKQNGILLANLKELEAQKQLLMSERSRFMPQVSITTGYVKEDTPHDSDEGLVGYISGNWNLFSGGRDLVIQQTKNIEYRHAELDFEILRRKVSNEATELYYEAVFNSLLKKLDQQKLEWLKDQRSMARKKINAGLTSEIDALEIELEESTLQAEIQTHRTDYENTLLKLKALLQLDEQTEISLEESFNPLTKEQLAQWTEQKTIYDQQAELKLQQSQKYYQKNMANFLPEINLSADYGRLIPNHNKTFNEEETRVGLLLTWELFSGFQDSKELKAAHLYRQGQEFLKIQNQRQSSALVQSLRNKTQELLNLKQLLEKRSPLIENFYKNMLSEFRRGVRNSSDLTNATHRHFENSIKLVEVNKELTLLKLKFEEIKPYEL